MTGPVDRDRQVDHLLRQSLPAGRPVTSCVEAEALAAWAEGRLPGDETARLEAHLADCPHCQAMLVAFADSEPAPVGAAVPFWQQWRMRWLVPVAAASAAVFVWAVATREPARVPDAETTMARAEPMPEAAVVGPPPAAARPAGEVAAEPVRPGAVPPTSPLPAVPPAGSLAQERARDLDGADTAAEAATSQRSFAEGRQEATRGESPTPPAAPEPLASAELDRTRTQAMAPPPPPPPAAAASPAPPPAAPPRPAEDPAFARQTAGRGNVSVVPGTARGLKETVAVSAGIADAMVPVHTRGPIGAPVVFAAPAPAGASRATRWRITLEGRLERSLNGGQSWVAVVLPEPAYVTAGSAPAAGVCWVVGRDGVVLVTTDAASFDRRPFPEAVALTAIEATDGSRATLTTADGRAFVTVDGGTTWRPAP